VFPNESLRGYSFLCDSDDDGRIAELSLERSNLKNEILFNCGQLCTQIEAEYSKYENDMTLIAQGIVRPCGQCVWRDALAALRDEVPGHFFAPIFPPN
jgi:hypothetical protein